VKQITAVFFIVLYVVALARPAAPLLEYLINYDYISEELCENKTKPQMECNGKCYLAKQFEAESKKQNKPELNIKWQDYPIGFVQLIDKISLFGRWDKLSLQSRYLAELQPAHFYLDPFPPQQA
jgi:hypothetical protein